MKKSAAKTTATAAIQPTAPIQTTAFALKLKQQTTREAIAANVDLLIEQLEAGHSEDLTAYLTAMGHFRNYSFGNILEIARQKPSATHVAGLYAWNQLRRRVKKGERGIRILVRAPVRPIGCPRLVGRATFGKVEMDFAAMLRERNTWTFKRSSTISTGSLCRCGRCASCS